jgi:uncharacterized protein
MVDGDRAGLRLVIFEFAIWELVVAAIALTVGSAVQTVIGFGMALIAVPIVLAVGADGFVPGVFLVVLMAQAITLGLGERRDADVHLLSWFIPARVVGTIAGTAVAASVTKDAATVIVGALVLAAVAMSWRGLRVPYVPAGFLGAGVASGFSNVLSSIGGPPLALTMQDRPPPVQRATQGFSAMFGSVFSMVSLAVAGRFGGHDLAIGLLLIPAALVGTLLGNPLRRHVHDANALRPWLWTVAVGGSVAAVIRVLAT